MRLGRDQSKPVLVGLLWVSPWLAGFGLFIALPMAMSLYYSFTDYPMLKEPLWIGLDNWLLIFSDPVLGRVLLNTALYAALFVPVAIALSVILAVLLNAPIRGQALFRAAIFVPTLVPLVASAMVWLWLFNGDFGLINAGLRSVGINGPNWLEDANWALFALVLMGYWGIGQAVIVHLAALQDVPRALYEAAALDGAGPLRRLWHITLPSISPAIQFNVIVMTVATLQVFTVPYIMTEGGPARATYFYTHYLYDNAFVFGKMGYASVLAWMQGLTILALTGVLFLLSRRAVHYRAA